MNQGVHDRRKARPPGASSHPSRWHELRRTLSREFNDIRDFYLDDEQKVRLEKLGRLRRGLFLTGCLLKSLILKLTPVRRLLLLVALFLLFFNISPIRIGGARVDVNFQLVSCIILIFILMLELKDKLLAKIELAEGREIQKLLMPESCPEISGWDIWFYSQPANDVGGDLVDCICLGVAHYGLILGDVSGKGLPAALMMAKLQATVRALAGDAPGTAELGGRLNRIFQRDTPASTFATLVYIDIRNNEGHLNFLNAGHMPPVIISAGRTRLTPRGDLALGLDTKTIYQVHEENLAPGDWLAVYSDGINEAKNEAGEIFGSERLLQMLPVSAARSAADLGRAIIEAVGRFSGDARRDDDQTLLIIRRLGE